MGWHGMTTNARAHPPSACPSRHAPPGVLQVQYCCRWLNPARTTAVGSQKAFKMNYDRCTKICKASVSPCLQRAIAHPFAEAPLSKRATGVYMNTERGGARAGLKGKMGVEQTVGRYARLSVDPSVD